MLVDEVCHRGCQFITETHEELSAAQVMVRSVAAHGTPFGEVIFPALVKDFQCAQIVDLITFDRCDIAFEFRSLRGSTLTERNRVITDLLCRNSGAHDTDHEGQVFRLKLFADILSEKEQAADNAAQIKENAGLNYRMMTAQVNEVLANLKDHHPDFNKTAGYDLAGFVWFQGFNDQFSPAFRDNYKDNMITFVKDVRKEFKAENLPFVIGVMGTGITAEKVGDNAVSLGQRAAAKTPEFKGNVAAVESYQVYDLSALEVFNKGWKDHIVFVVVAKRG